MNPFIASLVPDKRLPTAALVTIALLLQAPVFADIYKWTDGSGEVHYTQTPPPGGITAQTIAGVPLPAESEETVRDDQQMLQQQLDANEERRAEQEEQQAIATQRQALARIDKENCITAQGNLAKLQQGGIKRYLTPEGEVIRLSEEERQRRISEAHTQIDQYCSH